MGAPSLSPADLLQALIRFDTTNPPGKEAECIQYVDGLLREAGFLTTILAKAPDRPNLVTRLEGRGVSPPLLVHGHVDVVTTAGQDWVNPPFDGRLANGYVWGRGTLDMKGGVAMLLSALLMLKANGIRPPGDVILAILADEEAGSDHGARFLVEHHPALFKGVRYAIGEGGGTSIEMGGRHFYPIGVAEKRVCWMRVVLRGPGGHGSMPIWGGTISRLERLLGALDSRWLPVHVTSVARLSLETMAADLSDPLGTQLRQLCDAERTDVVLAGMGELSRRFGAILHNTVSVTTIRAGQKVNVIPSEIEIELDGRLLPGFEPADLLNEIRAAVGTDLEIDVVRTEPGPAEPDLSMLHVLEGIVREEDPEGVPVPVLLAGFTDGCQFTKLGIQNYGFLPAKMPPGFNWEQTIHGANERIPVKALEFGVRALHKTLLRFGTF